MLKSLDHLSVRPLEAINLIRNMLKVEAKLIPMSESPVDLMAIDDMGNEVYGEVNVDALVELPQELRLYPRVKATAEAIEAIHQSDLILIGPGSFFTSLMPLLLLDDITNALRECKAPMIYIGNLGKELSTSAASLSLKEKLVMMEQHIGCKKINAVIVGPRTNIEPIRHERLVTQRVLEADDIPYRHDRKLLLQAIEETVRLF